MQQILQRLADARIELLPITQIERHWVFGRDGFVSLVERTNENGFGKIGSPGLLTDRGMAVLVVRGEQRFFVAKGIELPATDEQVETMRRFARDLASALA
jgi:hypothetical protein